MILTKPPANPTRRLATPNTLAEPRYHNVVQTHGSARGLM
jgi:hypothetical protein